jgi:hypothetical protein
MGCTAGVGFSTGGFDFYLLHSIQTSSLVYKASYAMGTRGLFPWGVKQPEYQADHLYLVLRWRYTSIPLYIFMA